MTYKTTAFDWFLFACLVVIWGSSFAMSKIAVQTITPEWISALRLCIGAAVLVVAVKFTQQWPELTKPKLQKYFWLGIIGNSIPFFLITWGVKSVSSGVSGLLMGTIPIIILVMAHFFLKERLHRYSLAGVLLGFAGLMILLDPRGASTLPAADNPLWGELAIVAGCLCYGVHSISATRLGFDKPFQQGAGVLTCGAIGAVIIAAIMTPSGFPTASVSGLIATLGLGLFPTGLATVIMYKLMERTSPTLVSQSNYLVPVFAVVLGSVALGETIELNVILALALILIGIFVSRLRPPISQ
jgi:drug/metabolite transporter (DMT)-like permease